jgi:hypothetical protein
VRGIRQCLGVLLAIGLAAASVSSCTTTQRGGSGIQPVRPGTVPSGLASARPVPAATQRIATTKAAWRAAIAQVREPGYGCYHAAYPALRWHAVTCVVVPNGPAVPSEAAAAMYGAPAKIDGSGYDYGAQVPGLISRATGTFQHVSPHITEKGSLGSVKGKKIANAFSLQLNTEFFATPLCSGSKNPASCMGWQQFTYGYQNRARGDILIEYWLLNYDTTCPVGWSSSVGDCYLNSPAAVLPGGALTAADLATVQFSASATAGGQDGVSLSVGSGQAALITARDRLDLAAAWNTTEWGVFGVGGSVEAYFGPGTTLEAQTVLTASTPSAPVCIKGTFTGESNNLKLASTPALGRQSSPTMASRQTNGTTGTASCAVAGSSTTSTVTPISGATNGHATAVTP